VHNYDNSNNENEIVYVSSTVNSKGSVVEMSINGKACKGLIDTGATVCVISNRMYKSTGCSKLYKIDECIVKTISGVGGKCTPILGKVNLPMKIEGLAMYQEFLLIEGSHSPEVILGENFLCNQHAQIDYCLGTLSLQQGLVTSRLLPTKSLNERVCLVRTMTEVVLEPKSEYLLPVKVTNRRDKFDLGTGVIEPNRSLPNKWQIAGANCAVSPSRTAKCSYRVLNPYDTPRTIPKNTVIGKFSPVNSVETSLVHASEPPLDLAGQMSEELIASTCVDESEAVASDILTSNLNPGAPEFTPQQSTDRPNTDSIAEINYMQPTNVMTAQSCTTSQNALYIERLIEYSSSDKNQNLPTSNVSHVETVSNADHTEIGRQLGVNIDDNLTEQEKDELLELVGRNRDVFATSLKELGCYKGHQHIIDTGDAKPCKSRFYRASPDQKREIERQVNEMLETGIISRSTSDWLSPVILVRKSNGTYRLVVDYRGLNKLVKPIYFPLPRHEDVVDTLGEKEAKIFSTLDLAQAFLQTELDPATKHRSAFIVHNGVYEYNRTPYGLSNSPASFGIVMSKVLRDFLYIFALVYADDILVYSSDLSTHKKHLQTIFDQLRKSGLTLKPTKCTLGAPKVKFLGHVFSEHGVAVDPEKTKAIDTFPVPTNATQIKSFLGLCQYYRKFCKSFSHICSPLTALLQKDAKFFWDSNCQQSFLQLKKLLTSSPILAFPSYDREFILYTDASCAAISYILGQKDKHGREVVIEYGGRSLRSNERRWAITELEGLAMIEGIRHYHLYLTDRPFTLVTDHAALQYIESTKMTSGRLSRWALFLQQYRMKVQYKKGKLHTNADSLSRRDYPPTTDPPSMWVATSTVPETTVKTVPEATAMTVSDIDNCTVDDLVQVLTSHPTTEIKSRAEDRYICLNAVRHMETVMSIEGDSIKVQQQADQELMKIIDYLKKGELPENMSDKECKKFIAESHEYVLDAEDELLYHLYLPRGKGLRANRIVKQLVVPTTLKHEILLNYHDSLLTGHGGFDRTFHLIRLKYYWTRMYNEIREYVKSCQQCQQNKKSAQNPAPLNPLPCLGIFKRVHVDLFGPLPQVDGYKYVLLIVDAFSKWTEAFPVKTLKGEEIAKIFYREYMCRWGAPYSLLSDRGTNFLSGIVTEVCKLFKVDKFKTSSWHPQTNATAERRMAVLGQTLRMFTNKHQTNWPDLLPSIMAGWRATPSANSTMFSPFRLLLGEEMRLPIDVNLIPNPDTPPDVFRHLQDITEEFSVTREMAKENIKQAQEQQKLYHDKKAVKPTFKLADKVWLNNVQKKKGLNPKLQPKYVGPYYIADVGENNTYLLHDCITHKPLKSRINAQRLKLFVDEAESTIRQSGVQEENASEDELDDVSAQDTGPLTDQLTDGTNPSGTDPDLSQNDNVTDNSSSAPSATNNLPVPAPLSQSNLTPPNSQTNQGRIVESLMKCQNYRGTKWYLTKWQNHKFKSWVIESHLPGELVRKFHIEKTHSGKRKKAPKHGKTP
jgi:hypothetical protein